MRRLLAASTALTLALGAIITTAAPQAGATLPLFANATTAAAPGSDWLTIWNSMRKAAGSAPVTASPLFTAEAVAAARCLSNNGQDGYPHTLNPALPCGTGVDFAQAARGAAGSLITFSKAAVPPRIALEQLARAPFHAMSMLHPGRQFVGFGTSYNPDSPLARNRSTTTVHTGGSLYAGLPITAKYTSWPAAGWAIEGTFHSGDEWPSPLWHCGVQNSGPPIWFMPAENWYTNRTIPKLANLTLVDSAGRNAGRLCTYDGTTYTAPGQEWGQQIARQKMLSYRAVVVVPLTPLTGGTYTLRGTINGTAFSKPITVTATATATAQVASQGQGVVASTATLLDTKSNIGHQGPLTGGTRVELRTHTNASETVATARHITLTASGAIGNGQITISDCNGRVSDTLTFTAGGIITQQVTATAARTCLLASSTVHVLATQGAEYVSHGAGYDSTQTPRRLIDTRGSAPLGTGIRRIDTGVSNGIIQLSVVTINPATTVSVTAWPCSQTPPAGPTFTAPAGVVRANTTAVPTSDDGSVCLRATRDVHIVADRLAAHTSDGSRYTLLATPVTIADSTQLTNATGTLAFGGRKLSTGETYQINLARRAGVPESTTGAVLRITASSADTNGHLTIGSCPVGATSTMNVSAASPALSNTVTVPVSAARTICVNISTGMHLSIKLVGYTS